MVKPKPIAGLRHVALFVKNLEACERFYVELLGMTVEWRPDADNIYLTSGVDNLALHRLQSGIIFGQDQRLDHIGLIVDEPQEVDEWFDYLRANDVVMKTSPRTHRDGARSFYCIDPDGITVQMIYHPPLAKQKV